MPRRFHESEVKCLLKQVQKLRWLFQSMLSHASLAAIVTADKCFTLMCSELALLTYSVQRMRQFPPLFTISLGYCSSTMWLWMLEVAYAKGCCNEQWMMNMLRMGNSYHSLIPLSPTPCYCCCTFSQLLEVMNYLHNRWIVHRDLKLSNLLLTNEGCLKLCDYGLARYFKAYEEAYTPKVVTLWYRQVPLCFPPPTSTKAMCVRVLVSGCSKGLVCPDGTNIASCMWLCSSSGCYALLGSHSVHMLLHL